MSLLIVSLGSALGALFRFWATTFINRQALSESFPWSTFLINMLACFLIGYLTSVITSPLTQILLTSGVLGGFSTFSTFANEVVTLFKQPNTKKTRGALRIREFTRRITSGSSWQPTVIRLFFCVIN
ncbi:fluoride efflux transporter FluC [Pediococcus acidilactici]|uniref:fluoride efflux transporter FluC n=1 Tax=Pediococcus acidilactici TaxID=1254 RepID=UPI000235B4CD|nr:CrcB family protein [Pediococcus acidilactici]EHJ21895.1 camphor resistance protein CrcB [Pediococcus acidilactici MA18/5M]